MVNLGKTRACWVCHLFSNNRGKAPLYLRRSLPATLYTVALLLSFYVFDNPPHLEWFLPILFFKILVSHVLREEPYQPEEAHVVLPP